MTIPTVSEELLKSIATREDVKARVNARHDALFHKEPDGSYVPLVCTFCDHVFVKPSESCYVPADKVKATRELFVWDSLNAACRKPALEDYYSFSQDRSLLEDSDWLDGMALSPRGRIRLASSFKGEAKAGGKKSPTTPYFTCCVECKESIYFKGKSGAPVPMWSIINSNYIGGAPECLSCLNETEMTLISPIHKHGFTINWTGGKSTVLQGTMTLMRVKERKVSEMAMALEQMGLTKHVLILITGRLTAWQRKKAHEKSTIRTDKVIAAVEWLVKNHPKWKHVDLDEIRDELRDRVPVVKDISELVQSANQNVEEQELFTAYFPDGRTNPDQGGFETTNDFKNYVEKMATQGYDVELQAGLKKKFVADDSNDQLISGCLLCFPYGIGGMDCIREVKKGKFSSNVELSEFLEHLSRKADPCFQTPMIQLLMFSQVAKVRLLEMSRLQVRGEYDAEIIANGLDAQDVRTASRAKSAGYRNVGTNASKKLLAAVDACSRALPHSNEAAKKARTQGEAMQHHLGQASIFVTTTFDDNNSFLLQVLTGNLIDDAATLSELTDEELLERRVQRCSLRINFPGFAAINFEMKLSILCEEVLGWDIEKNCPTGKPGFFGIPLALNFSIEEQGRKTLHGHMEVWIKYYEALKQKIFFGSYVEKRDAKEAMQRYYDHCATTKLFPKLETDVQVALDHECSEPVRKKRKTSVVSDQALRNLRHRKGFADTKGVFSVCSNCNKTWTYEKMVSDMMCSFGYCAPTTQAEIPHHEREDLKQDKIIPFDRLASHIIKYQKPGISEAPIQAINAHYNAHTSCHTTGCFRCAKKGKGGNANKMKGHVCTKDCECRYRLPDRKRKYSTVTDKDKHVSWYSWKGDEVKQPLCQILPRRGTYDLYQNISCPAISESKFTCNSNISLILDGPISMYIFKYIFKPTQEDEAAEYAELCATIKKVTGRKYDEDKLEAVRLIRRSAFAHSKKNIIAPPLASYLVRNKSRFYFSHESVFCPIRDVMRLHDKQKVGCYLKYSPDGSSFFENQALNYVCRPDELEHVSLNDFSQYYKVTYNKTKPKKGEVYYPMKADTGIYKHPSVIKTGKRKGQCKQAAIELDVPKLSALPQWEFPDTANFNGNMFTCQESDINKHMEHYAQLVMTLFYPHRHCQDLMDDPDEPFPYALKLREVWEDDILRKNNGDDPLVFTEKNCGILQNIQNSARNCTRFKIEEDDLASVTIPFTKLDEAKYDAMLQDKDEVEDQLVDDDALQDLMGMMEDSFEPPDDDNDPEKFPNVIQGVSFSTMRQAGINECGYKDIKAPKLSSDEINDMTKNPFVETVDPNEDLDDTPPPPEPSKSRIKHSVGSLVRILFRKTSAKRRNVFDDKFIDVGDANGTVASLREWSKAAFRGDRKQERAFEAITAAFLLTFFEESEPTTQDETEHALNNGATVERPSNAAKFRKARNDLRTLRGIDDAEQMICLLHGPGGSGKSTVLNMVQAYARSFCEAIGHPYTARTIVVTAMSGVAATLLHGETTHDVLGLNRSRISTDEQEQMSDCRLLIIDEISFAHNHNFEKMQDHVSTLMRSYYKIYGGLNIVFAGDYSQLEPVLKDGGRTVYKGDPVEEFQGSLNVFIELDGKHRFVKDPSWGDRLLRFRKGQPTLEDIRTINRECDVAMKSPPVGIQVASYANKTRDAVNCGVFEEYCRVNKPANGDVLGSAVLIFMDDLEIGNSKQTKTRVESNVLKRCFYQSVGENGCVVPKSARKSRVDPVLKLYRDGPLMLTKNQDVGNGQANGSRVVCRKVNVKIGEHAFPVKLECGTKVWALMASQVDSIIVKHTAKDIDPPLFKIKPETYPFHCEIQVQEESVKVKMSGLQFPLISNSCTTGHKLQGCSMDDILVNDWHYRINWVYVVLSRVRTMAGLYLRQPLIEDLSKYEMCEEMLSMLEDFRDTIGLEPLTEQQYQDLIGE